MMNDDNIIGHIAVYGETSDTTILEGLLIDKRYRGKR